MLSKQEISALAAKSDYKGQNITFIPVSALKGDNVVTESDQHLGIW